MRETGHPFKIARPKLETSSMEGCQIGTVIGPCQIEVTPSLARDLVPGDVVLRYYQPIMLAVGCVHLPGPCVGQ